MFVLKPLRGLDRRRIYVLHFTFYTQGPEFYRGWKGPATFPIYSEREQTCFLFLSFNSCVTVLNLKKKKIMRKIQSETANIFCFDKHIRCSSQNAKSSENSYLVLHSLNICCLSEVIIVSS